MRDSGFPRDPAGLHSDASIGSIPATVLRLYTIAEVSELTRMSEYWLREQCRERRIAHHRLGRSYRLSESDLGQLAAESRVEPRVGSLTPTRHRPRHGA
ncbi:helix-turn-helix domain-containing protein [Phycicoccus sp. Soil803]|uniref:helix-turn-helix domain-containing protein n=1 Tax=Phycicoccus sp. Soil803 TaxID=1736415 RepID=UPI003517ECE1